MVWRTSWLANSFALRILEKRRSYPTRVSPRCLDTCSSRGFSSKLPNLSLVWVDCNTFWRKEDRSAEESQWSPSEALSPLPSCTAIKQNGPSEFDYSSQQTGSSILQGTTLTSLLCSLPKIRDLWQLSLILYDTMLAWVVKSEVSSKRLLGALGYKDLWLGEGWFGVV